MCLFYKHALLVLTFSLIAMALDAGLPFLFVEHKDSIYYYFQSWNPSLFSRTFLARQEEKAAAQTGS